MIRLKNIEKNDLDIVTCDIYPEDSANPGKISFDMNTLNILDFSLPFGYEWGKCHVIHAGNALKEMCKSGHLQNEKMVMWY